MPPIPSHDGVYGCPKSPVRIEAVDLVFNVKHWRLPKNNRKLLKIVTAKKKPDLEFNELYLRVKN